MNLHSTISSNTRSQLNTDANFGLEQLGRLIVHAKLGLVGGALGTAMTIGLAILVQAQRFAPYLVSSLLNSDTEALGLKIVLIISGLTSLIETHLLMSTL